MDMDDERLDLSALDPAGDPVRFARLVAGTMDRAETELRRRASADPIGMLARWTRPMLAAAAITAVASGTVLMSAAGGGFDDAPWMAHAEPASLSALVEEWVAEVRTPSVTDLMIALEGDLP
jgi:hypothetical protein